MLINTIQSAQIMPCIKEIKQKYEKELAFCALNEELDLYLFEHFLTPYYHPSTLPLVMCVGVVCEKAPQIIQTYHQRQFGLEKALVVGCNKTDFKNYLNRFGYDKLMLGNFLGDALETATWLMPLMELGQSRKYDLVFIRNPMVEDVYNWTSIFQKSLEYLTSEGALVTIIRQDDASYYRNLLSYLQTEGIEPVFSQKTGITGLEPRFNYHHIIGIFKNRDN